MKGKKERKKRNEKDDEKLKFCLCNTERSIQWHVLLDRCSTLFSSLFLVSVEDS